MAARVLMFPSYGQEKLITEVNCLVVLLFSYVILLEGHLIFSLSPLFKGQTYTEKSLEHQETVCFPAFC